jgi:hypothetical protein
MSRASAVNSGRSGLMPTQNIRHCAGPMTRRAVLVPKRLTQASPDDSLGPHAVPAWESDRSLPAFRWAAY